MFQNNYDEDFKNIDTRQDLGYSIKMGYRWKEQ